VVERRPGPSGSWGIGFLLDVVLWRRHPTTRRPGPGPNRTRKNQPWVDLVPADILLRSRACAAPAETVAHGECRGFA